MKKQDPGLNDPAAEADTSFYSAEPKEVSVEPEVTENEVLKEISVLSNPGPFIDIEGRVVLRLFITPESTYIGYLLEETSDSFYVLFLSYFSRGLDEMVSISSPSSASVSRLMKTSVSVVTRPTPSQVLYFLSLTEVRANEAPSYFTDARLEQMSNIIEILKKELKVVRKETNQPVSETAVPVANPEPGKKREMTDKIIISDTMMSKLVH